MARQWLGHNGGATASTHPNSELRQAQHACPQRLRLPDQTRRPTLCRRRVRRTRRKRRRRGGGSPKKKGERDAPGQTPRERRREGRRRWEGRKEPKFGRSGHHFTNVGQFGPKVGHWAGDGQKVCQQRSLLAKVGRIAGDFGQVEQHVGKHWQLLEEFRRNLGSRSKRPTMFGQCCGNFGARWVRRGALPGTCGGQLVPHLLADLCPNRLLHWPPTSQGVGRFGLALRSMGSIWCLGEIWVDLVCASGACSTGKAENP